jgi:creatinine amidohydrolase/Fe(II)-dependent formamide hydrolase-like protein
MPLELARITSQKLGELSRDKTVFFFPVGPMEDHGPHLPLGLDPLEAQTLCIMAAEKLERDLPGWVGVLMPTVPLGVNSDTTRIAITVRGHVLRDWLVDACRSLERVGFAHFVCFSGHLGPHQLTAIEDAGKLVRWRGPLTAILRLLKSGSGPRPSLISASSAMVSGKEVLRSPLWPDALEHGSRRDTSVGLALDLVPPAEVETLASRQTVPRVEPLLARLLARMGRRIDGYWGTTAPAQANRALGEATLRGSLDEIFPKLRAVWEGANPNMLFRSWYSILPPNQSFFRAWLFAAIVFILLLFWIYVTLPALIGTY